MKISYEEVKAAVVAWDSTWDSPLTQRGIECMRLAIAAAYTVRKARKAKKRAKAKPSILDEEVQAALNALFTDGDINKTMRRAFKAARQVRKAAKKARKAAEPAAPEPKPAWNGKYEVGKSYRTRDGRKATDLFVGSDFVAANIDGAPYNFHIDGSFSVRMTGGLHPLDLIGPWKEPAAPAWNGKFEVGKAYRTRGGGKAIISSDDGPTGLELYGVTPNGAAALWPKSGVYDTSPCTVHDFDLIGPWED